jgi:Tfp pilus assembly protein PilN
MAGEDMDNVGELRTSIALLQQQNAQNTGMLQTVRDEVRELGRSMESITRLQERQQQHDGGLERAFSAIRELGEATQRGFEKVRTDEDAWRKDHVGDNDKIKSKVTWFSGMAAALSLVAASCVGIVMYYTNKADAYQEMERARLEKSVDNLNTAVHELQSRKIYYDYMEPQHK